MSCYTLTVDCYDSIILCYVCSFVLCNLLPSPRHQRVLKYRVRQKHLNAIWSLKTRLYTDGRFRADSHHTLLTRQVKTFPRKLFIVQRTSSPGPPARLIQQYTRLFPLGRSTRNTSCQYWQGTPEFISNPHGNATLCYDILSIATAWAYWKSWWPPRSCRIQTRMINTTSQGHISVNIFVLTQNVNLFHFKKRHVCLAHPLQALRYQLASIARTDAFLHETYREPGRGEFYLAKH